MALLKILHLSLSASRSTTGFWSNRQTTPDSFAGLSCQGIFGSALPMIVFFMFLSSVRLIQTFRPLDPLCVGFYSLKSSICGRTAVCALFQPKSAEAYDTAAATGSPLVLRL